MARPSAAHSPTLGEPWYETGTAGKWKFTSYERDSESNLDYAMARHYSNTTGRFMSPDPLAGRTGSPQSLNRYAYATNNPTNATDPLGLCSEDDETCIAELLDQGGGGGGGDMTPPDIQFSLPLFPDLPMETPTEPILEVPGVTMEVSATYDEVMGFLVEPTYPFLTVGSGGGAGTSANKVTPPALTTCTGGGRGLKGNSRLVGKQGGIPGQTVQLGTAAVIPQQFGVPSGAALGPYAPYINGTIGQASFSAVTDVIGGKSPIPGTNVRTALQQLFPGQLILEIPGASDQGANAPVTISVPQGLGVCPTGTSPAGGG